MRILKTHFRNKNDFLRAYNEDLECGGVFCPTTRALDENEPVVVELNFPGLPNKTMLRGKVVWWRPALPRLRIRAGAMVAFLEADQEKKEFILKIAGGDESDATKRRHTRVPVEVRIKWRAADSHVLHESDLKDISIGGALLLTDESLQVGDDIVLEFTTPGGATPISIACKVTYRGPSATGVRFIYRDGGGSQRLREVVRRLINRE